MAEEKYSISQERIKEFGTLFLLERMVNTPRSFSVLLEGDDSHLEDLLTFMVARDYLDINDKNRYVPTKKGREVVVRFKKRYQDFLKNFDCYCAVDLGEGEFAFEQFWEFEDEDEWCEYLEEERWEDLRVAVAQFKKLDPLEIVFMGFLNEDRFEDKKDGWQFDLVLGTLWDDLTEVCNCALALEDLAYEDDEGNQVSGEDVMKDILKQGGELNIRLRKQEEEMMEDEDDEDEDEDSEEERVVERVVTEEVPYDVYESYYYDPFYISPVWAVVIFL